jgi:hypothetical protein
LLNGIHKRNEETKNYEIKLRESNEKYLNDTEQVIDQFHQMTSEFKDMIVFSESDHKVDEIIHSLTVEKERLELEICEHENKNELTYEQTQSCINKEIINSNEVFTKIEYLK